jgi:hypothetical protein
MLPLTMALKIKDNEQTCYVAGMTKISYWNFKTNARTHFWGDFTP